MSDIIETPIADLIVDERCQARENMNWDAVGDYRAAYEAGESLPPLEVFEVKGKLVIVDGFHRYEAATRAGVALLPVTVVAEGSMADAIREALGKNHKHGVQRTQKDKRKAVRMALALDDDMSNRGIATLCNVSHTLVANIRKGKVEQLELTMPEPDTKEPRQTTDLTEIVEDVEGAAHPGRTGGDEMTDDLLPKGAGLIYYEALAPECFVVIPVLSDYLRHGDVIAHCVDDDVDYALVVDFDSKGPVFGFLEIRGDEAVPVRTFKCSLHWAWWGAELDLAHHLLEAAPVRDHEDRDYRMPEDELTQRLAQYRSVIGRKESELPDMSNLEQRIVEAAE